MSARFGELCYQILKSTGQRGCEIWGTLLPNTLKTRDKGHHGGQSTATCGEIRGTLLPYTQKHGRKVEKQAETNIKDGGTGRGTTGAAGNQTKSWFKEQKVGHLKGSK